MDNKELLEQIEQQICNDLGLSQSDSSEMAAKMCLDIFNQHQSKRVVELEEILKDVSKYMTVRTDFERLELSRSIKKRISKHIDA